MNNLWITSMFILSLGADENTKDINFSLYLKHESMQRKHNSKSCWRMFNHYFTILTTHCRRFVCIIYIGWQNVCIWVYNVWFWSLLVKQITLLFTALFAWHLKLVSVVRPSRFVHLEMERPQHVNLYRYTIKIVNIAVYSLICF